MNSWFGSGFGDAGSPGFEFVVDQKYTARMKSIS